MPGTSCASRVTSSFKESPTFNSTGPSPSTAGVQAASMLKELVVTSRLAAVHAGRQSRLDEKPGSLALKPGGFGIKSGAGGKLHFERGHFEAPGPLRIKQQRIAQTLPWDILTVFVQFDGRGIRAHQVPAPDFGQYEQLVAKTEAIAPQFQVQLQFLPHPGNAIA